jgi:hypothetical protein
MGNGSGNGANWGNVNASTRQRQTATATAATASRRRAKKKINYFCVRGGGQPYRVRKPAPRASNMSSTSSGYDQSVGTFSPEGVRI